MIIVGPVLSSPLFPLNVKLSWLFISRYMVASNHELIVGYGGNVIFRPLTNCREETRLSSTRVSREKYT